MNSTNIFPLNLLCRNVKWLVVGTLFRGTRSDLLTVCVQHGGYQNFIVIFCPSSVHHSLCKRMLQADKMKLILCKSQGGD